MLKREREREVGSTDVRQVSQAVVTALKVTRADDDE